MVSSAEFATSLAVNMAAGCGWRSTLTTCFMVTCSEASQLKGGRVWRMLAQTIKRSASRKNFFQLIPTSQRA
jgi:hypothetical protein